jgi:hypothetical protein
MGLKKQVQKKQTFESNEQDMKITSRYMSRKTINRLKQLYEEGDHPIREFGGLVVPDY